MAANRGRKAYTPGGALELIVAVAAFSRSRDLDAKLNLYERMGVRESLIAVASREQLLWRELTESGYRLLAPEIDGVFRSRFFPGLSLDPTALRRKGMTRLLAVLQ
jgi:hypothetical protein